MATKCDCLISEPSTKDLVETAIDMRKDSSKEDRWKAFLDMVEGCGDLGTSILAVPSRVGRPAKARKR